MPDATARPQTPAVIDPAEHLTWCRAIARGVRLRYRFWPSGADERDLESEAYLAACACAARFDPQAAFRIGTERAVERACETWERGTVVETRLPAVVTFGGVDQTDWVLDVARRVAKRRGIAESGSARLALAALAVGVAAKRAEAFDTGRAFRGWACREVRTQCIRLAIRLRNGGTFSTARTAEAKAVVVHRLKRAAGIHQKPLVSYADGDETRLACEGDPYAEALYVASRQR